MSSIPNIPLDLITYLVSIMEKKMENFDVAGKFFMIQYSFFIYDDDKWIFKNLLDIGNETITKIDLEINQENNTNFTIYANNIAYPPLQITRLLDTRNKSRNTVIFAPDLYLDFEPKHYIGKCYTNITKKIEKNSVRES